MIRGSLVAGLAAPVVLIAYNFNYNSLTNHFTWGELNASEVSDALIKSLHHYSTLENKQFHTTKQSCRKVVWVTSPFTRAREGLVPQTCRTCTCRWARAFEGSSGVRLC